MGNRPYVSFDEIKQKISMREILEHYGLLDQFRESGGTLVGACPFPDHVHGPSPNREQFRISRVDAVDLWRCWGDCKQTGNVIQFVMKMEGLSAAHVRFVFAELFGDRLTLQQGKGEPRQQKARDGTPTKKEARPVRQTPERANVKAVETKVPEDDSQYNPIQFRLHLQQENVPYLQQRGITDETIRRYGIGLCKRGMLKGYVAIPIWENPPGEFPYGYLGRWAGEDYDEADNRPRYKWPPGFPKSRFLYGLAEALTTDGTQPLIVVEGAFKVFHLVQNGFPNTVAIFGSTLSDEQASLLADTRRPVCLLFDGDEAGQAGMRKAAAKLITRTYVRVVKLPSGGEPDDLDAAQLQQLLQP